jgi:hypothetical protein
MVSYGSMELLPYIFAGVLIVLTIVMTVVGVQLMLVLLQMKRTLQKINSGIDAAGSTISTIVSPLQQLGATAQSVQSGFRVLETFTSWLQKNKQK